MSDINTTQFPRVSSGTLSAMLLEKVLQYQKIDTEILMVRSKDVIESLLKGKIDFALVHYSSIEDYHGLSVKKLLKWKPVLVSASYGVANQFKTIVWEEGSFGDILLQKVKNSSPVFTSKLLNNRETRKGKSFLSVLELVRRELPYQVVLPDIYLTKHDKKTLFLDYPDVDIYDELVAVYREEDRDRLTKFVDKESWEKVFLEHTASSQ
jgi:hypothetical protein